MDDKHDEFLGLNLEYLYELFVTLTELRTDDVRYLELFDEPLYRIIRSSVARNYIISFAALLDPPQDRRGNFNLSVRSIPSLDLRPYESVIRKIDTFRDKLVAHNDQKMWNGGDSIFQAVDLTPYDTEPLLLYLIESYDTFKNPKGSVKAKILAKKDVLVKTLKALKK